MILLWIEFACIIMSIVEIIHYKHKYKDVDEDDFLPPFGPITIITALIFIPLTFVAICNHMPYYIYHTRTRLQQDRECIEYELTQYNDIMQQGIHEAKEYNKELLDTQYKLHSPIYGYIICPVYDEFEPIKIPDVTMPK